jgi:hypothetical protein
VTITKGYDHAAISCVRDVTLALVATLLRGAGRTFIRVGCPRWVKNATLTARRSLPVFPYEPTSAAAAAMSQRCQEETHAPQQSTGPTRARICTGPQFNGLFGSFAPSSPQRALFSGAASPTQPTHLGPGRSLSPAFISVCLLCVIQGFCHYEIINQSCFSHPMV